MKPLIGSTFRSGDQIHQVAHVEGTFTDEIGQKHDINASSLLETNPFTTHCSFFALDRTQIPVLVVGPGVSICSSCITQCVQIFAEDLGKLRQKKEHVNEQKS